MKTLSQLLDEQKAAGMTPVRADADDSPQVPMTPPTMTIPIVLGGSLPGGTGALRLLPPGMTTPTSEWIAANWQAPSPWCRIPGLPEHEDFQKNLLACFDKPVV